MQHVYYMCCIVVSQAIRIFPRAHARGKGAAPLSPVHAHEEKYEWLARLAALMLIGVGTTSIGKFTPYTEHTRIIIYSGLSYLCTE